MNDVVARRADWLAAVIVGLGLALRLVRLGDGLWYDEVVTLVEYASRPIADIVGTYTNQNQHVLYSILARVSLDSFGESPFSLRLPAALFGAACIWGLYRLGRTIATVPEALFAAALVAVSYHHIWFSQNARGYTGLMLFAIMGTIALNRLLSRPGPEWRWVVGYAIVMGLSAYTHLTSVLASAAHGLVVGTVWIATRRSTSPIGSRAAVAVVGSGIVALGLYLPILPELLTTPFRPTDASVNTAWVTPSWFVRETLAGLAAGVPGGWVGLVGGGAVMAAGVVSYWRQSRIVAALLLLPALVTLAAALLLGHTLRPRFFVFSLGFLALIAVRGTYGLAEAAFRHRGRQLATLALVLVSVGASFLAPKAWGVKQDFLGAADFVARSAGPEDAVVTVDLAAYPYQHYYRRSWPEVKGPDQLLAIERAHRRTWLLYTFPIYLAAVQPEIWDRLRQSYDTAGVFPGTVRDGSIVVMVSRPSPAEPNSVR